MARATLPVQIPVTQAVAKPLDLQAVKKAQQTMWASGDFSVVAARIVFEAELLCEAADLQAGDRVLDVATGSGNAALAAARRGATVLGVDYVPALLERARLRAAAEHLEAEFSPGDAEALPVADASFDVVLSIYGVMFAPDHRKAAAELARACRPGGKIALASWTPDGFIGQLFKIFSRYVPPAPGLTPGIRWGEEEYLKEIFGSSIGSIESRVRTAIFRDRSAEENVAFFRQFYGPTIKVFASLPEDKQAALTQELADAARRFDRNRRSASIAIRAEYLETIIQRA